jgi:hypothetical protein
MIMKREFDTKLEDFTMASSIAKSRHTLGTQCKKAGDSVTQLLPVITAKPFVFCLLEVGEN